jgi:hypothetical protein
MSLMLDTRDTQLKDLPHTRCEGEFYKYLHKTNLPCVDHEGSTTITKKRKKIPHPHKMWARGKALP